MNERILYIQRLTIKIEPFQWKESKERDKISPNKQQNTMCVCEIGQ